MDTRLLELLVCPLCKGPLDYRRPPLHALAELVCRGDRLAFPIRDGIPVMLESEARAFVDEPTPSAADVLLGGAPGAGG